MPVSDFDPVFEAAGREWNVDPNLLRAMAAQESSGNPRAVSKAGAQGLMQIMPATQRHLGVTDPMDPTQSIYGGAKYMSEALDAEKSPQAALLYYHGGKDWRDAYGPESAGYVPGVTKHYQRLTQGGTQAVPAQATKAPAAADDPFTAALNAQAPAAPAAVASDPFTQALNAPDTAAAEPAAVTAAPDAPSANGLAVPDGMPSLAGNLPSDTPGTPGPTGSIDRATVENALSIPPGRYNGTFLPWTADEGTGANGNISLPGFIRQPLQGLVGGIGNALTFNPETNAYGLSPEAQSVALAGANPLRFGTPSAPISLLGQPERDLRAAPLSADFRAHPLSQPIADMPGMTVRPGTVETPAGGAAGADITTAPIPAKTPAQRIADLEKSVQQTAEERAGPQLRDATPYVDGIPPRVRASSEFTPANALDHKVAIAADPAYRAEVEATTRERNNGMVDLLRNDAADGNGLERAHDYRDEVKPGPLGVFDDEKPVDASGLVDKITALLRGQEGKQAAVRNTLKSVMDSLHDADGGIETLPSMLYGARKNLTDLLKKGVKGVGDMADDVRASKSILMNLLPDFDKTISEGAPKFSSEYLPQFHERSLPIDQMEFLQRYQTGAKKITDGDGYLQPNKVQKMLDDVLQGLKAPGVNAAKSLTDRQIQNIINVRNELAADKLRDRMASVRGSDSFQQINRAITPTDTPAKAAVKGAAVWGAHGAMMATPAAGWGNALLGGYQAIVKPAVKAAQERKAAAAITARKNYLLTPLPPEKP